MDARVGTDYLTLSKMPVTEFVDRVVEGMRANRQEIAWFLGAGCSRTSDIPAAAELVEQWLNHLAAHRIGKGEVREAWLKREFGPDKDWTEPAAHYGEVFHRCHPSPHERQVEIERICRLGDPGIGYATMAQLLSHPDVGDRCNTVLTTNFDDLLAEALYFYGSREGRPKVISHEALSRFMAGRSRQPTIVKIHGDALFDPKNTKVETRRLAQEFQERLPHVLQRKALVFVGYGGRDESIQHFFETAPEDTLGTTVYWVGTSLPPRAMLDWLVKRNAQWVEHGDFDELMCLFRKSLELGLPDDGVMKARWERLGRSWAAFEKRFAEAPDSEAKAALAPYIDDFRKSLPPGWFAALNAHALAQTDPEAAEVKWREAIAENPNDPAILGDFATFLTKVRGDRDGAEAFYKRALDADPTDADHLGNYAIFLTDVRGDHDGAEAFYKRALAADPAHANTLGNYANFLTNVRGDHDGAEAYYKRAIDADPVHADHLGNYAKLLLAMGRKSEGLERLYRAFVLASDEKPKNEALLCELIFYLYAHDRAKGNQALRALKVLIEERRARTPGWNFDANIERAGLDGHPEVALLRDLAKVLSHGADRELLDNHVAWRMA